MVLDRKAALEIVKKVLTADFACEERHFGEEGVFLCQAREIEGARRFPFQEKFLAAVTMGKGIVICCSVDRIRWARTNLGRLDRDRLLDVATIARMQRYVTRDGQEIRLELKYICTRDTFKTCPPEKGVKLSLAEGESLRELYKNNRFPNALGLADNPQRPHKIAIVAKYGEAIACVAAATADCDVMWQIGVDTLPEYRRHGIARAAVAALTGKLLSKNILPYYSARFHNIASRRTALAAGYFPAWVELYSREIQTG